MFNGDHGGLSAAACWRWMIPWFFLYEVADWGVKMEEIRQKIWELGDANA